MYLLYKYTIPLSSSLGAYPVCPAGDAVRGAAHQQSGYDGNGRRGGQTGEWRRGRGLL